jgi:hypothetical protein
MSRALVLSVFAVLAAVRPGLGDHGSAHAHKPHLLQRPTVTGSAVLNHRLRTSNGRWSGRPARFSIRWLRCDRSGRHCTNIAGARGRAYTIGRSDVGHRLRAKVAASNRAGSAVAVSAATRVVATSGKPGRHHVPPTVPPPNVRCSATFSSVSSAVAGMQAAGGAYVACLTSGQYGAINLTMQKSAPVTLAAAPGAHVVLGGVNFSGRDLAVEGIWIHGEVDVQAGSSFISLVHNDIDGYHGDGVVFDTSDCTVPNSPSWSGCQPQPKVTDVLIAGNHFHDIGQNPGQEDAIHLDNWARVRVTGNEFDHIIEAGQHTDCLQSVYGGTDLMFDHNYEHDNNCQGFFIKDGDATNVSLLDNLFIRDSIGSYGNYAQVFNTHNLVVERNTIWDFKGLGLTADGSVVAPSVQIDHNVISEISLNNDGGPSWSIDESYNIFGDSVARFPTGPTDSSGAHPNFVNPGIDDFRLAGNGSGIGVDWRPSDQSYGPAS